MVQQIMCLGLMLPITSISPASSQVYDQRQRPSIDRRLPQLSHSEIRPCASVGRSDGRTCRIPLAIRREFRVSKVEGARMLADELDRVGAPGRSGRHKCLGCDREATGRYTRLQLSLRWHRLKRQLREKNKTINNHESRDTTSTRGAQA